MSRTKKPTRHLSVRLAEDVAAAVATMATAADWSESKVLNHLGRVALAYSDGQHDQARAQVGAYNLAVFERQVHAEAAAKIRAARASERPDPDQLLLTDAVDQAGNAAALAPVDHTHTNPQGEPFPDDVARLADELDAQAQANAAALTRLESDTAEPGPDRRAKKPRKARQQPRGKRPAARKR